MKWNIHKASLKEWTPAMKLAWRTFLRFEAGDYTNEGIRNFQDFVNDERLQKMFVNGYYHLYVATENDEIIGMISRRDQTHISLLFVDVNYHRMGVGRALVNYVANELKEMGYTGITVNASPYGLSFYRKIGFKDQGCEVDEHGIRYTPMSLIF